MEDRNLMESKVDKGYNWLRGVAVLIIVLAVLIFVATPIQMQYGIIGVLITELLLLTLSLTAAVVFKIDFKEAFPVKVPRFGQVVGVVIMCVAGMICVSSATYVVFYFFPGTMATVERFSELYHSAPGLITWLIVSLSPAICEEALHRGFILQTFKSSGFKSKWPIVLWMGLLFGVFHLDPPRFLTTAILGMIITYIALESGNIILAVLYHLANNSLSVLAGLSSNPENLAGAMDIISDNLLLVLGPLLIYSAFALFFLRLGARLIGQRASSLGAEEAEKRRLSRRRSMRVTVVGFILLLIAGAACIVASAYNSFDMTEMFGDFINL